MSAPGPMPPLPSNPAENDSARIVAATMVVTMAAFITYLARMYVRVIMVRSTGLDVSSLPIREGGAGSLVRRD
jgi:hypothetical protein